MKLFIPNECSSSDSVDHQETRCAATPQSVAKLTKRGITVSIEQGAGESSLYSDSEYQAAGATMVSDRATGIATADTIAYVNRPSASDLDNIQDNTLVIGHLDPFFNESLIRQLTAKNVTSISVEMIPRSTRAQKMDALSSQASLAGYVMTMMAVNQLPKILPMMMTPSGTIKPSKVFVIGAGVAGLQVIATARRLGATVLAYDTRSVVSEQVESLGAKFLQIDLGETGQTKDGYATELTDEQKAKQQAAQQDAIVDADIVITTAQLFGRKPPMLISKDTLAQMRPGSVVVDMAAESGGNVEGSVAGETIVQNGVSVIGQGRWSQRVPRDATDMYANNVLNLIDEFFDSESGKFEINLNDDILHQCVVSYAGSIISDVLLNAYQQGV